VDTGIKGTEISLRNIVDSLEMSLRYHKCMSNWDRILV
jgi:hypothetical protein